MKATKSSTWTDSMSQSVHWFRSDALCRRSFAAFLRAHRFKSTTFEYFIAQHVMAFRHAPCTQH